MLLQTRPRIVSLVAHGRLGHLDSVTVFMITSAKAAGPILARGSAWISLGQVVSALTGLVGSIVAARLLTPDDFGLMGIVLLTLATLNALSQTGFDRALIQRKEADDYMNVAWTVQAVRGLALSLVLVAAAWPLSWFYDEPRLLGLFAFMSTSVLAAGVRNVTTVFFHRALDFRSLVVMGIVKALI